MCVIPMELIEDILLRLPVKPLLCFRCVSKPFRALIDSHNFIKSYLKRSTKTTNHLSLILDYYFNNKLSSLKFDSLDNAVEELDHPNPLKPADFLPTSMFGSCDGLIGLMYPGGQDHILAIWNPWTRRCQKLPLTKIDNPANGRKIYGFGYDSVTDDYKVVTFVQFTSLHGTDYVDSKFQVYSMKSNSWRKIRDFPYFFTNRRSCAVLVGSSLHLVASQVPKNRAKFVVALDLATEGYREVPQPEFSDNAFDMNVGYVAELGGFLCIVYIYNDARFDVWVMKDYGVKESWSKLFSVVEPELIRSDYVIPIAYSKSGCEVLLVLDHRELVWYDLEHKTIKKMIKTCGMTHRFGAVVCVESLVPLNG